ncbi:MAG: hypothetical protein JRE40_00220 [Deltaproteobacteria bacterium]|nr:hypothetical protein [Deltaproteobacteria bacterium]
MTDKKRIVMIKTDSKIVINKTLLDFSEYNNQSLFDYIDLLWSEVESLYDKLDFTSDSVSWSKYHKEIICAERQLDILSAELQLRRLV